MTEENRTADSPSSPPTRSPATVPGWVPLAVAAAVPTLLFFFLPPLSKSGLWDPYELNVADLSRRIALKLYGASNLALDAADNTLPHLNDLGRPQLPFSSIALGFKLFGLHEWAGRLPLAIWALLGVLSTYAFVARLFDRRTGAMAAVVLSTMPLYFVQARSMLGDVCTMAALAMSFGGLAVALFDRQASGVQVVAPPLVRRLPWLGLAAVGLLVGFESRGGLLGLAVPLLGVGLAWGVGRVASPRRTPDLFGDVVGAVSLVAGVGAVAMALRAAQLEDKNLSLWLGAMVRPVSKYPTFDYYVAAIGHSLAPWSAFVPFAIGRMLANPVAPAGDDGAERESLGRMAIIIGAAVAFVAHAYLVATTDLIAFGGPVLCAVACAVALRDFWRGARASIAIGVGTLVLAAVLHHDFHELPEKAYQAFGIASATFPEGFKNTALNLWWVVLGGFAVCAFLTWVERDAERRPFDPASYGRVLQVLRDPYEGALAFIYFALVACTAFAGLVVFVGKRTHATWLPNMSASWGDYLLNAWWVVAFVPLGVVFGLLFACDLWLWAFGRPQPLGASSLTRGFEPFEALFEKIADVPALWSRARGTSAPAATPPAGGEATPPAPSDAPKTEPSPADDDASLAELELLGLAALTIFLLFALPAATLAIASLAGMKVLVGVLVAAPAGVASFLVLGILGDVLGHRAPVMALGGGVVGAILCFSYYPALANQLSPKEVFESYRHMCPGGQLGLLGVGGRSSAYYAGGQPQTLSEANAAYQWLSGGGSQRRCLALKAEELPKLNQLWREHEPEGQRTNLPVVDARSSQILLASSTLGAEDKNDNPLAAIVLSKPPSPQRRLGANMDDKLEVIGFDLNDDRGRPVDAVTPGRDYHFKTYYRVLAPVTTEWEGFIHIDGYHRRHNGDHKVTGGKYPMSLWLPGDFIADDHEFKLEPNFTPGTYAIYFGLFVGDTRLKVSNGPNDGDNRINGGQLRVQ
jgi:4-amino-4-deoxy-L-arabinose transferase-like glycosyltransferase